MAGRKSALQALTPDYPHTIATNEYGFYCVPDAFSKREVPQILARGAVYEPDTLNLLRRLAGRGGDVISGGAFVGDFLPALAEVLDPGAKLHTFEPHPDTYRAAAFTLALNDLKGVTLHPVAVSSAAGTLKLQTESEAGQPLAAAARIVGADATGATVDVDVCRLDDLVAKSRKVSVLHLDIEDHEIAALSGAERIIEDNAPVVILEAAKRWKQRAIATHLNEYHPEHGYAFCGQVDNNSVYLALKRV